MQLFIQDFLTELINFEFLDPGNKGENISYWHSDDSATVNNQKCDEDAPQ